MENRGILYIKIAQSYASVWAVYHCTELYLHIYHLHQYCFPGEFGLPRFLSTAPCTPFAPEEKSFGVNDVVLLAGYLPITHQTMPKH